MIPDTVFIDLGNVIVNVNKEKAIKRLSEIANFDVSTIRYLVNSGIEEEFERGKYTAEEYINTLHNKYHIPKSITLDILEGIWAITFTLNNDIWNTLPKIRKQAKLYLLSNTNILHWKAIENKYNISDRLDGAVLSYEVGYRKPDPKVYYKAVDIAKTETIKSIFVDDSEENVLGAKEIGINAYRFRNLESFREFLKSENFDV
jgi:putative hydrolase of the HAD superfamily